MECAHEINYVTALWLGPNPLKESQQPSESSKSPENIYRDRLKELDLLYEGKDPSIARTIDYQHCMILGQLKALLGAAMDVSKLIEELAEKKVTKLIVSSKNLPEISRSWVESIMALGEQERTIRLDTAASIARCTREFLRRYLFDSNTSNVFLYHDSKPGEHENIIAIITIISESIEIMQSQYKEGKLATGVKPFKSRFVLETCTRYKKEMVSKGWCPFVLRKLESMTAVVYAMNHKPVPSLNGHADCTELVCKGNEVKGDKSAQHYPQDCCCGNIKPPFNEVLDALVFDNDTSSIPILALEPPADDGNQHSLKVTKLELSKDMEAKYVAVSHVWSDGLRGSTKDGLPTCQLERIDKLVRKIEPDGGGAFWVDALCIMDEKRSQGIQLMGATYKGATKVLVIDAGIRGLSIKAPLEKKLLRILTSVWMQRLWTLQEAIYAKEMYFEFRDGLMSSKDLLPNKMTSLQGHLAIDLYQLTLHMPGSNPYSNIWDVSRAISTRSAGREDDETLAIVDLIHNATTTSYKLADDIQFQCPKSEILSRTPEREARAIKTAWASRERMKGFLKSIPELPRNIPFLHGPKLKDHGFRWAPESFMRTRGILEDITKLKVKEYVRATDNGLECSYMSFKFEGNEEGDQILIKTGEPKGEEKKKRWIFQAKDVDGKETFYEMLVSTSDAEFLCNIFMIPYKINPGDTAICIVGELEKRSGNKEASNGIPTRHNCRFKGSITIKALKSLPAGAEYIVATGSKLDLYLT